MRTQVLWLALAGLLAACSTVPEAPPPLGLPKDYLDQPATRFDEQWWQQFADPALQRLLRAQAQGSLTLRQQLERVSQTRAGALAQGSSAWPQLALNGSASSARSGLPEPVKRAGQPDVRAHRATLDLQWEIDLFGAVAAARRAAIQDAVLADAGLQGARLLVQVELAQHYLAWQSARRRLPLLRELIEAQAISLQLAQARAAEGWVGAVELEGLRAELEAQRSQEPALQVLEATSRLRMALLLGRVANDPLPELQEAPSRWPTLPALAPGQPAELLLRRPDLQAAAARAAAARERATQAQAERWPRLFLGAFWGRQDLRLNGTDLAAAPFQQLGLAFVAPVFSAGRLQGIADAQAASARAAAWAEQEAVLTALTEVESALRQRQAGLERQAALARQLVARQSQQRHVERLHQEGLVGRSAVLAASRARLAALLEQEQAEWAIRLDALQLAKALGGGWNPKDTP